jgi:hypothetical protein
MLSDNILGSENPLLISLTPYRKVSVFLVPLMENIINREDNWAMIQVHFYFVYYSLHPNFRLAIRGSQGYMPTAALPRVFLRT